MKSISIKSPLIAGEFVVQPNKKVLISIVAYEYPKGIPARFCAGLIPAIDLSKQLESYGVQSKIRVIDPTSIANYCNGWEAKQSQVRDVAAGFLNDHGVNFFFDEALQVSDGALEILSKLGGELEFAADEKIAEIVQRVKDSGERHGGENGSRNAFLYMAAHPFSWLDMYHPLIWPRAHASEDTHFVNLMSKSESRFTEVRKFLQKRRPELCTGIDPIERYMTICNTPCYIRLEDEPAFAELTTRGYNWCRTRYHELRERSSNHRRANRDFESLVSFLGR
ncbi:MAG: hypothetical protein Q8R12_05005 [bacterium]|nr:hypothetical protein [bacterium]